MNIYFPNAASERKVFFLICTISFLSQGFLLIGGDFNCIDNVLDKLNCSLVSSGDNIIIIIKTYLCRITISVIKNCYQHDISCHAQV